jgi:hypothetical protein
VYAWIVVINPFTTPIRRAAGIGDHRMRGFQGAVIHAVNHRGVDVLVAGRREDDFLRAGIEVGPGLGFAGEQAGALEHHIDAKFLPWQFGGVALGADFDLVAIDDQVLAVDRHGARKFAMGGVVLGQVGIDFRVAQVVDRNDLNIMLLAALVMRTQDVAADAAIAVYCNADGHWQISRLKPDITALGARITVMLQCDGGMHCAGAGGLL